VAVLPTHMSVSGNCEICVTGEVRHTCSRCAQLVCDEHFDEETGLCVECLSDVGGGRGRERQPPDAPDGVDTYRF
jgi:hypothetical protein